MRRALQDDIGHVKAPDNGAWRHYRKDKSNCVYGTVIGYGVSARDVQIQHTPPSPPKFCLGGCTQL